jgi:hypothetical protein
MESTNCNLPCGYKGLFRRRIHDATLFGAEAALREVFSAPVLLPFTPSIDCILYNVHTGPKNERQGNTSPVFIFFSRRCGVLRSCMNLSEPQRREGIKKQNQQSFWERQYFTTQILSFYLRYNDDIYSHCA